MKVNEWLEAIENFIGWTDFDEWTLESQSGICQIFLFWFVRRSSFLKPILASVKSNAPSLWELLNERYSFCPNVFTRSVMFLLRHRQLFGVVCPTFEINQTIHSGIKLFASAKSLGERYDNKFTTAIIGIEWPDRTHTNKLAGCYVRSSPSVGFLHHLFSPYGIFSLGWQIFMAWLYPDCLIVQRIDREPKTRLQHFHKLWPGW